ncbi:MAG: carbohydrate ABC transporter permease [Defluviitaleaceae bacterium]|nr:carbohydrate ABC transporter permease [Defluviitaleaceae bacterium]
MTKKTRSLSRTNRIVNIICLTLVIIFAAICLFPIWWMVRSSLMSNMELYTYPPLFIPSRWLFSNYLETLETFRFFRYFFNTMLIIVPAVTVGTITATIVGYAFARMRFRGRDFFFALCVGSMLLPPMVTLIPIFLMWVRIFGISDSYAPLILPFFTGGGAFNIFLIRQFIMTIPRELDEAAKIDGAGSFKILTSIIMPSIRPAMIVVSLFLFIFIWNDLLQQSIYIYSERKFTIAIALTHFRGGFSSEWYKIMAATCMSFVPGVVIYLIGQRYFVEGIVMTGMKN